MSGASVDLAQADAAKTLPWTGTKHSAYHLVLTAGDQSSLVIIRIDKTRQCT
jgi:hypothetical protein